MKVLLLFLLSLNLLSCSSLPKVQNIDADGISGPFKLKPGHGAAFGTIVSGGTFGTAMVFINTKTNEELLLTSATRILIQLPAGRYQVSSFGGRAREVKPLDPYPGLEFEIVEGKATYLGYLVLMSLEENEYCDFKLKTDFNFKPKAVYPHVGFNRGLLALGSIKEVSWDRQCLLKYDNYAVDYMRTGIKKTALKVNK
jgi:hypothetical protein